MEHPIELEIRAEVLPDEVAPLLERLAAVGKPLPQTRRLSAMFFGECDGKPFSLLVRITNGQAEVVMKRGEQHAHNRVEVSQTIEQGQFMGMARLFAPLTSDKKIGERVTYSFELGNSVLASLVQAGHIAYLELEKMSTAQNEKVNHDELLSLAMQLGVKIIESKEAFRELCLRLTKEVDWVFHGRVEDYARLEELLQKYI